MKQIINVLGGVLILGLIVGGYLINNWPLKSDEGANNPGLIDETRDNNGLSLYKNDKYRFSLMYPNDLYVTNEVDNDSTGFSMNMYHKEDRQIFVLSMLINNPGFSIGAGSELISNTTIDINGLRVNRSVFEFVAFEDEKSTQFVYQFSHAGNEYVITVVDNTDEYVHDLISTLKVY